MHFGEAEIQQLVESIWTLVLGWEATPDGEPTFARHENFLTGCISITGAWEGTVILDCATELARHAAGQIFATDSLAREETCDALGELTNMLGGNLKALLPEPCQLGLPSVTSGDAVHVVDARPVLRAAFRCRGQRLRVSVLERRPARAARPSPNGFDRAPGEVVCRG